MEIKCPACESGYRIPLEKLPADKEAIAFPCPNCSHPLTVNLKEADGSSSQSDKLDPQIKTALDQHPGIADSQTDTPSESSEMAEPTEDSADDLAFSYDASEKPFVFVDEGERTALVCESDEATRKTVRQMLEATGFNCAEAESTLAALKQMRYHPFDLVVLNEHFDGKEPEENPVRIYLSRLPMATRRNIFVVLLTRRFRTMDNMAAFHLSVNQVIHEKHINQMERVIERGLAENEAFYKIYHEAEKTTGDTEAMVDRSF